MIEAIATAGATTVITKPLNKAVKKLMHIARENGEKNTIESGAAFEMYLYNAYDALNWKRTLASGDKSLCIIDKNNMGESIGENNMYVDIGAYYRTPDDKKHDVDTSNVKTILSANKHEDKIIVDGTGGAGKSMLMRYLFVDTVSRNAGDYIPVYMELAKIKANSMHEMDIRAFVHQSMELYGKISLSDDVFDYSLEQGGYVFLFDGFDEVKENDANAVLDALQKFSAKYSNNAFIISSRERLQLRSLSSFQIIHAKELSKDKAIELAQKFPGHPDTISRFCKNLKDGWFQEYNEFAKSPLLLTMMFITFEQNGDISNCLPDFYQDCFDALYNKHDAVHKVGFKRNFHCDISKSEFQAVFSYFCFHTCRKEIYDFSEDEILNWLEKSLKKQNLSVSAEDYLKDLTDSLCIITCEGHRYRFAHRSFQTYFAAKYTRTLSDQQQKEFLTDKFNWDYSMYHEGDYLNLLNQVEHERFLNNFIEPIFQDFMLKYHSEQIFFQHILSYSDIEIFSIPTTQYITPKSKYASSKKQIRSQLHASTVIEIASIPTKIVYILTKELPLPDYERLLVYACKITDQFSSVERLHSMLLRKYSEIDLTTLRNGISLRDLLHSDNISKDDKNILSNLYLDAFQAHEVYQAITDWLAEREEAARQKPSSDDKFADY